jgi:starch-binding outer membrane protein, SusD/RagB family
MRAHQHAQLRNRAALAAPSLVLASLLLAACGTLDIGDLNDPGLNEFQNNPSPASIAAVATGLLVQIREDKSAPNGYVSELGIIGRESYNFDAADPRFITELLEGALNPGNRVFGGNFWEIEYRNIRNANLLLAATDAVVGLEPEQKEAVRGYAKTIAALEYLHVINTHDTNGAVIQVSADPHTLDPIVSKAEIFAHIKKLLDEAKTHLLAGGMTFPFMLGSGFAGFNTPATFLQANRALKARVDIYTMDYPAAVAALGESFITSAAPDPALDKGIYMSFSTSPGDNVNQLTDPNIFAHPSVRAGAEMQANGMMVDARVAAKLTKVESRTVRALTSDDAFTMYASPSSRIPIIRNEELILLRAEAAAGMGNYMAATMDINFIRQVSGGLAPVAMLTADTFTTELLKQRFYSLLFEGGHRWLDMRRLGRLDQLPNDRPMGDAEVPAHRIHALFPIPQPETDARTPQPMQ